MAFENGQIVKSLCGHDQGRYYVVVRSDEKYVFLADGKRKRLNNLKTKSIKHVALANQSVVDISCQTDKTIRTLINRLNNEQGN